MIIARRPSVKPTASGTLFVLLMDPTVFTPVGCGVEVSADASSGWRTLYEQMGQVIRERESQVFCLVVSLRW